MKKYLRQLYYSLPIKLRYFIRRLFYFPYDLFNKKYYNKIQLPPKGIIYTGGGDFLKQAFLHRKYLIKYADLKQDSIVLDIGSGIGRSAIGLVDYLDANGEYYGFDIIKRGVDWCNKNISSEYKNFHFEHILMKNDLYSNSGIESTKFIFPYKDNTFDVVFLMSVFTHLQIEDIRHYLSEIQRVLKPEGRCLSTFFIYDEIIEDKISNHKYYFNFKYKYDNFRLMNNKVKNANIAINYNYLREMAEENNLIIDKYIPGFWTEEVEIKDNDFQDIIVFRKK